MADPIGLTFGFLALVDVFTACVDCFKLVQIYRGRDEDYDILQTMLDNQQFHFMAWGKACGFDLEEPDLKKRFDDPASKELNLRIKSTMERVKSLLINGDKLKSKYGLKPVKQLQPASDKIKRRIPSAFEKVFQSTSKLVNTSLQRTSHIAGSIHWMVDDKDKFTELIKNLRDLISDLNRLTTDYGISQSVRWIVRYELENIRDQRSLEVITEVSECGDDDDMVSVAASRQLLKIKGQSTVQGRDQGTIIPDESASVYNFQPTEEFEDRLDGLPQPVEVTRLSPSEWRKVKTGQGLFPWLGVLIVCTTSPQASHTSTPGQTMLSKSDVWSLVEQTNSSGDLSESNSVAPEDSNPSTISNTTPSRLAVNSRTLLSALAKITGREIPESNNVMVHPFKYLVAYAEKIRKAFRAIDQQCAVSQPNTKSDTGDTDGGGEATLVNAPMIEGSLADLVRVRDEVSCLIELMDTDLSEIFDTQRQIASGKITEISFDNLWLLYTPGTIVFSQGTGDGLSQPQAYFVLQVTGGRTVLEPDYEWNSSDALESAQYVGDVRDDGAFITANSMKTPIVVDCFYLDTDGRTIGPRPRRFIISSYSGFRHVESLPIYPMTLVDGKLKRRLVSRGKRFIYVNQERFFLIRDSGRSLGELDYGHVEVCRYCYQNDLHGEISGQLVVDAEASIKYFRGLTCTLNIEFGGGALTRPTKANPREIFEPSSRENPGGRRLSDVFDDTFIDLERRMRFRALISRRLPLSGAATRLDADDYILFTPRVYGFVLNTRRWYPVSVDELEEVRKDHSDVLNLLAIPEKHKVIARGLARAQKTPKDRDIIHSKTCRCVLLHGPPGVGKTFFVECVAHALTRPLLVINCGELGSLSRGADTKLETWFLLAERWNCVLLLIEADEIIDFQGSHIDRKPPITSVLLRLLDYFSGLVFFTTSGERPLNANFRSRVIFSLYFTPLDREQQMKIWEMFSRQAHVDKSEVMKLGERLFEIAGSLNGRQIRNIWIAASSIASSEGTQGIEANHLETAINMALDFDEKMQLLR